MLRNINRLIFPVLTALATVPVGAYADGPAVSANAQLAAAVGHQLNDAQMDTVTAGQVLGIECAGCTLASSNSMSANGTTIGMSSTGVTPGAAGGGGNGGSGGTGGGGTGGAGGSGGGTGSGGPTGPSVLTSAPAVPANLASIIGAATSSTIGNP